MQTFLPYKQALACARVLDPKRLGKQRVEAKQVLQALLDVDKYGMHGNTGQSFQNHPIRVMWEGHESVLLSYTWYICREWRDRGYQDGIMPWLFKVAHRRDLKVLPWDKVKKPWWWGEPELHVLHKANLLIKDPSWYKMRPGQLGLRPWVIPIHLRSGFGYNWPLLEAGNWRLIRRLEE